MSGLVWSWGGRRRADDESSIRTATMAALRRAPVRESDEGRVEKLQEAEGNPFRGSAWAGDG